MIFAFAVRYFRWLAHVPGAVHLFDAMLLVWTALMHSKRIEAIEAIEKRLSEDPAVRLGRHRFGGIAFLCHGKEFAHIHGNGLLDVRLTISIARELVSSGAVLPHHVLGDSSWVSFWVLSADDVEPALTLLGRAQKLHFHAEQAKVVAEFTAG